MIRRWLVREKEEKRNGLIGVIVINRLRILVHLEEIRRCEKYLMR